MNPDETVKVSRKDIENFVRDYPQGCKNEKDIFTRKLLKKLGFSDPPSKKKVRVVLEIDNFPSDWCDNSTVEEIFLERNKMTYARGSGQYAKGWRGSFGLVKCIEVKDAE